MIRGNKIWMAAAAISLMLQCTKEAAPQQGKTAAKDSANVENSKAAAEPGVAQFAGKYSTFVFPKSKRDSATKAFKAQYSADEQYKILALNRLDAKHIGFADTLVVPDKIEADFRSYSPFPHKLDVLADVQKIVIFSYPIQAFAVYSSGVLEKWGPSSMGKKKTPTRTGLTFTNWKKELSISTVKDEWKLPYNFNIYNQDGIGWHEYDLPGYPASHSCLRLLQADAKYLFDYADQWILNPGGATTRAKGTPVIVYGEYPWGRQKPWRRLAADPRANDISEQQLTEIIQPYKEKILAEQANRARVEQEQPAAKKPDSAKASQP